MPKHWKYNSLFHLSGTGRLNHKTFICIERFSSLRTSAFISTCMIKIPLYFRQWLQHDSAVIQLEQRLIQRTRNNMHVYEQFDPNQKNEQPERSLRCDFLLSDISLRNRITQTLHEVCAGNDNAFLLSLPTPNTTTEIIVSSQFVRLSQTVSIRPLFK